MSKNNIEAIYPLSPLQQGLLFHTLYNPQSEAYFDQLSCTLQGRLDVVGFERAWQQVIDRHPVLRTAFVWERKEKPLQVVRQQVRLPLEQEDWRGLDADEQQQRLDSWRRADRQRGFVLTRAPLMRLALLRLADETYQLIWSSHHILLDGWSTPLVIKEIFACYEAFCRGQQFQSPLSRPYRDYIKWLQQQDMSQAEAYWRETLKGFDAPIQLFGERPTNISLATSNASAYEHQGFELSADATARLQAMARQHQLTPNTIVQGAWALLLARYSGASDVVFGVTVSGRPGTLAGVEQMVGLFINTLPLRVKVEGERELIEWLKEIHREQVEMREYEYSPLVEVQRWSEVPRGEALFETILVFENYPIDEALEERESELQINNVDFLEKTNYAITVSAAVARGKLSARIGHDSRLFEPTLIKRMAGHLRTLLEGMARQPQQRLAEIEMLSEAEQQQLLVAWNDTAADYPTHLCIHHLFEAQVERTPDAVALVCGAQRLTYRQLNRRANQLAQHLLTLGVGTETRVAVLLERSPETVIALLATFKAGGTYLPLDPTYPQERLRFILDDAQAQSLITMGALADQLLPAAADDAAPRRILLDAEGITAGEDETQNVGAVVGAEQVAYLIYTSGSTGTPKAVMVEHRNLVNTISASLHQFSFQPTDSFPLIAPFVFDISLFELFNPLLCGARAVILTKEHILDPGRLVETLRQVTLLHTVPSLMRQLIDYLKGERGEQQPVAAAAASGFAGLRRIFIGGDSVAPHLLAEMGEMFPAADIDVLYGPTEASIICTSHGVRRERRAEKQIIGRPLGNVRIRISDGEGRLVPVGVVGEIYVGGGGVTRGYWGRAELTEEKYVRVAGERYYRTGDMGRWTEAGEIEYVGRVDEQVKVRGHRVELGEVEEVLRSLEGVGEAVVVAREEGNGEKRLVAYVVGKEEGAATVAEMLNYLRERLPEYMLPSSIMALPELPLTSNGKVDRRRLPAPDESRPLLDLAFAPARTPVEEMLTGLWSTVLQLSAVGIHDNFFELGGHSLLATQVISHIRATFRVEVPLRSLFEQPTVAELAEVIEAELKAGGGSEAPPLERVSRGQALPLSFAQQRLWFIDQLDPGNVSFNLPAAVRLLGQLDIAALELTLNEIVRRHEALRTSFATEPGQPVQLIHEAMQITLPVNDLSHLPENERDEQVKALADAEAQRPFDLTTLPLMRVTLLRLAEDDHVVLFTMHHIISDGWSMGVLMREISVLYSAFAGGATESPLPELPIQYADYAVWQRQWLQGETLHRQLAYWKQQLEGMTHLEVPTDRPRPARQSFRGEQLTFALSSTLTQSLHRLSRQEGATLFMTLLAAFQTLLYRTTGQEDIVVGADMANRNRKETEDLIGFFVNMLVLRTKLTGEMSFRQLLGRVREVALGAYTHQDVPFEMLVEELESERDLSRNPLFQVAIVLQNATTGTLELPGLRLESMPVESGQVPFDIILSMNEGADRLNGALLYNTDLYRASSMERMLERLVKTLESVAGDADRRLCDIELLSEEETKGYAPEKFGKVRLSRKDFENLVMEISDTA